MTVLIKEIKEKNIWEQFVLSDENGSFLQSWNWGEFQKTMGEKVFRLGIFEEEQLVGVCLLIKIHAKRGNYLICPAGPLINWEKISHFKILLKYLKKLGKKENASFVRIRPPIKDTKENRDWFQTLGCKPAPMHLHAERTWFLDITAKEENLLAGMRKTTRYLIKKADRDGVEIFQSDEIKDIAYLYYLQKQAVSRHQFVPFSKKHFVNMFKVFSKDNQASLFLAKYKNEIVSIAMIMLYKEEAVYHYAATSSKYPKISSSHLLIWKAILEAKKQNFKTFNFWGIAPPNKHHHRFAGVTLFKKGFGGYEEVFLHAHDLPLNSYYLINLLVESIRKKVRRL
ncbi:peptidoglycan bridge formation glycyltransferase FemA/FemB family protein [Candidatus Microgenomates bacterium]|nr:peptidoglycan bridge formation glycyltransferase FemA/FemB family protein [Candidatus Microgenomates bacterium]